MPTIKTGKLIHPRAYRERIQRANEKLGLLHNYLYNTLPSPKEPNDARIISSIVENHQNTHLIQGYTSDDYNFDLMQPTGLHHFYMIPLNLCENRVLREQEYNEAIAFCRPTSDNTPLFVTEYVLFFQHTDNQAYPERSIYTTSMGRNLPLRVDMKLKPPCFVKMREKIWMRRITETQGYGTMYRHMTQAGLSKAIIPYFFLFPTSCKVKIHELPKSYICMRRANPEVKNMYNDVFMDEAQRKGVAKLLKGMV